MNNEPIPLSPDRNENKQLVDDSLQIVSPEDEDPSVEQFNIQSKIEEQMEELFWELKEYIEYNTIPIGDKLNIGYLIDLLHPKLERVY